MLMKKFTKEFLTEMTYRYVCFGHHPPAMCKFMNIYHLFNLGQKSIEDKESLR